MPGFSDEKIVAGRDPLRVLRFEAHVEAPFRADGAGRSVSGKDHRLIGEIEDFFPETVGKSHGVERTQCPSDESRVESVAGEKHRSYFVDYGVGRMARHGENLDTEPGGREDLAVGERMAWVPEYLRVGGENIDWIYLEEGLDAPHMMKMVVRDEDRVEIIALVFDLADYGRRYFGRIDEESLAGIVVSQKIGIGEAVERIIEEELHR
jgi:hypothetical protein